MSEKTLQEKTTFTVVFQGDVTAFKENPLLFESPFGRALAIGKGDAFAEVDEAADRIDALEKALKRIADGPWPDDVDSAMAQCRFDEKIARAAISAKVPT